MPFVELAALPDDVPVAGRGELLEVVHDVCFAVTEDLDTLLAEPRLRTERRVKQMREAAVFVGDRRAEVVVAPIGQAAGIDGFDRDRARGRAGKKPEHVVHVTRLADIAAATLGAV